MKNSYQWSTWRVPSIRSSLILGIAVLLTACGSSSVPESVAQTPEPEPGVTGEFCMSPAPGEPMLITEDCVDPRYNDPYFLVDIANLKLEMLPVPHYVVLGGYRGTPARFAFYFPLASMYEGRFFQGPTHPLRINGEIAYPEDLTFSFGSGAYLVESNPLQDASLTSREAVEGINDPSLVGYRLSAAAAKLSRQYAQKIYGSHRPFGYIYGGSGGAYQTIAAAENTKNVWEGFVPFVFGHPYAIPNNFSVRMHTLRVLSKRNKWPDVVDAVDPGGSGDPYATLNEEETAALREATSMGFPLRGWFDWPTLTGGPFSLVAGYVPILDPTYVDDFWSLPGYLGTDSSSSVIEARIQHPATIIAATPPVPAINNELFGPLYNIWVTARFVVGSLRFVTVSSVPEGDLKVNFHLHVIKGAMAGKRFKIGTVLPGTKNTFVISGTEDPALVNQISIGDEVEVDNSTILALQTYHRHQVPEDRDYYGWDQFRDSSGAPKYPQRIAQIGPEGAFNGSGAIATGRFNGKMILIENLMDVDALAWNADWYRNKAADHSRAKGERLEDSFRLWYTDYAQHTPDVSDKSRAISYQGGLQQAMRDLATWVEQGIPPPQSTSYSVEDSQIIVPATAAERKGIQPVVTLTANGGVRADIQAGESVEFKATVEVPPGAGQLVQTEWDFEGAESADTGEPVTPNPVGGFAAFLPHLPCATGGGVSLEKTHVYREPGTYFPLVRVTANRDGNASDIHACVLNMARVRVVVH